MEQYSKNAPTQDNKTPDIDQLLSSIRRLESMVDTHDKIIKDLHREIRRLRGKISQHADHINQHNRG